MTRKSLARILGVSVALQLLSSGVGEQDADAVARAAVAGARMLAAALPGHAEAVVAADVDEATLTAFRDAFRAQVRRIECCADAPVLDEVITSAGRASVLGAGNATLAARLDALWVRSARDTRSAQRARSSDQSRKVLTVRRRQLIGRPPRHVE